MIDLRALIVISLASCSRCDDAPPAEHDDLARAAASADAGASSPVDAAAFILPDTSWMISHDFDGDGQRDLVSVDYTGGAHCCYKLAVTLSTTHKTVAIPFELDGGYVGGLSLARPENFAIEIQDGVATLLMTIAIYAGQLEPIPLEWVHNYGVRSHRVRVSLRTGSLHVDNIGWSCLGAVDALKRCAFKAWDGLPNDCPLADVLPDLQVTGMSGEDSLLGSARKLTMYHRVTANMTRCGSSSLIELSVYSRKENVVRIDVDEAALGGSPAELVEALGPPEAKLAYSFWGFTHPNGQWVWPSRGLAIYVDRTSRSIRHVAVFATMDLPRYLRELALPPELIGAVGRATK